MIRKNPAFAYLFLFFMVACGDSDEPLSENTQSISAVGSSVRFTNYTNEDEVAQIGGPVVSKDGISFYIGYRQMSAINQDPILLRFDDGELTWARTDYDTSADDQTGYGLLWDGANKLYAVFSATGTQSSVTGGFHRYTVNGWLPTYGQGGGAKVSILAAIDPATGDIQHATFLSAQLSNGNSNTLIVTGLEFDANENIVVEADSWFSPRNPDTSPMECQGSSPFYYQLTFTPELSEVLLATATGCE